MSKNWKDMCKKVFQKDQLLQREQKDFQQTYRLLVLGTKGSGKTTVMKQMRILYGPGFTEWERKMYIDDIRRNLVSSIETLLTVWDRGLLPMDEMRDPRDILCRAIKRASDPSHVPNGKPSSASDSDMQSTLALPHVTNRLELSDEFWDAADALWSFVSNHDQTNIIFECQSQECFPDGGKWFLSRINKIRKKDYVPSDQDILSVRSSSSKSMETIFTVDSIRYHMFDVAGQRDQKGKWLQCFNNISAIIFVMPTSEYDVVLPNNPEDSNRLSESLTVFLNLWNSKWLTRKSVILFINKQDVFSAKIASGRSKLEDYFPDFRDYATPSYATSNPEDNPEVVRAKYFVRNEIMKITTASNTQHVCYPHFTTAIDASIRQVFDSCREIIYNANAQHSNIL
ncbi:GNAS (guanine nucleotide binding protein, alpha stimulating) [Ramazzottius varieornatus]|uniref:Adenylate cyclase-stimulating G alpha protein n=1 Tax=Ramazzottius varieornatus TaxID=947166 RepID=A0A1D1V2U2_RAMVA|nr:GNAS (guanine nucleotide binding protein, alpha stimulating) [Ramazzottius varieornatus]